MSCIIGDPTNLKIFAKAIQVLSKISDTVYLELTATKLFARSVSSSRSSYCAFEFQRDFFSDITCNPSSQDPYRCKIASRSAMIVFKSTAALEKNVDSCEIAFDTDECLLKIRLQSKFGSEKFYQFRYTQTNDCEVAYRKNDCHNRLILSSKVLRDQIGSFKTGQEEMTIWCDEQNRLCLKNFVTDPDKNVRTELQLCKADFIEFHVPLKSHVTFCLKELRLILAFAEAFHQPVSILFDRPGKPAIITVDDARHYTYCVDMVVATVDEAGEVDSQDSTDSPQSNGRIFHQRGNRNTDEMTEVKDGDYEDLSSADGDATETADTAMSYDAAGQEDDDDFGLPSAPPTKRFRKKFLGLSSSQKSFCASQMEERRPPTLVPDSDDDDEDN